MATNAIAEMTRSSLPLDLLNNPSLIVRYPALETPPTIAVEAVDSPITNGLAHLSISGICLLVTLPDPINSSSVVLLSL